MRPKRNSNGIQTLPISIFFLKFQGLVLGLERLLRGTSMWFKLYGRQAVRHELKKGPKTQKRGPPITYIVLHLSLLLTYLLWIQLTAVAHRH